MAAKEEINDAAEQLEQKRRELRESLRREALVLQELQATQLCVQELQKEVLICCLFKDTQTSTHTTHTHLEPIYYHEIHLTKGLCINRHD